MKNLFKNLMLVAVAAMGFTACEQVIDDVNAGIDENTVTMTFVADAPESRTSIAIDGDKATYSWSEGDKVGFYYVDVEATDSKKKNSKTITISGSAATFTADFESITSASAYNIGAFYPGGSWVNSSHANENPFNNVKVKIASGQALTVGSFDPNADLMMSKPFMGVALNNNTVFALEFTRIAAIGKMNLKLDGMQDGEVIKRVKFSLAEGTHFNGPVLLDLENGEYTLATEDTANYVELSGELPAGERTEIFFTCFPGEYEGDYTIEVTTDQATYTKTATLTKALSFTAGNVLNFNATVGNRYVEKVEVGHVVDVLDLAFTGVAATTTYADWSGKTHVSDAVYAGQSAGDKNTIQLRSNNNNSGIVTTASGGFARKITITWNSATSSGRTLNVYGKNTAYTAATDLYNNSTQGTLIGTIVCGTSTVLEIAGNYAFIGMRSKSGAMYIDEIKIEWESSNGEEPVLTKLDAPENLQATDITANSFILKWDTVENASSYNVTCGSQSKTVTTTTCEITGLTANTTYTVTVVANGDGVSYLNSDAAEIPVKTLAAVQPEQPGDGTQKFVKVTSAPSDWSGTYLIVYETGNVAFNGSLSSLDATSNTKPVTITNGEIEASTDMMAITFDIAKSGSNYTIMSKSGKYIGNNSNSNSLTSSASALNNTITFTSADDITIVSSGGSYLRYNPTSGQTRFRYFKSGTYTNQKAIQLYKLSE